MTLGDSGSFFRGGRLTLGDSGSVFRGGCLTLGDSGSVFRGGCVTPVLFLFFFYCNSLHLDRFRAFLFNAAVQPRKEQLDVLDAHDAKRHAQKDDKLFEEHPPKDRQIRPGGIVVHKDLYGLQKRRERQPGRNFLNVPRHAFERPGQPRHHDRAHANQVADRHGNGHRQRDVDDRKQKLREDDKNGQRRNRHERRRMQDDIDARQAIQVNDHSEGK